MLKFKYYISILSFVLLLFFLPQKTKANDRLLFEHLNTTNGLSNNTINQVFIDSKDFLWVCTEDGLNKYDGYDFKIYTPLNKGEVVDQSIEITNIIEDKYGRMWVGTSDGLYLYNRETDRFLKFFIANNEGKTSILNNHILCTHIDQSDYLWVGTFYGLCKINIANPDEISLDDYTLYLNDENNAASLSNNSVFSIIEDQNKRLWFSSFSNILDTYNSSSNTFSRYIIEGSHYNNTYRLEKRITMDKNGNFWIYTLGKGIVLWDKKKNKFKKTEFLDNNGEVINSDFVKSLIVDHRNRVIIGTDGNGIIIKDLQRNTINHYLKNNNLSNLNSNAIYSIYEDKTGTIWIGTYLVGINKLAKNKSGFGLMNSKGSSVNGLSHNIITSFCEDYLGQIWISTDGGGINVLNPKTFELTYFKHDPNNPKGLSTNTTITLFEDSDHYMWIGTYNGGLNRYDPKSKTFDHFWKNPLDITTINNNSPWSFEQDKFDNLWIATVNGGLNLLKKGSTTFIHYEEKNGVSDSPDYISTNSLNHLFIDSKENLWICTIVGLDMINLNKVDFSQVKPKLVFKHYLNTGDETNISKGRISYITEDHNGKLWIGTKGNGLNKLDPSTGEFTTYTKEDGLPHDIINGIIEVDNRYLWISTNNGLSRFDTERTEFKNFGISDGLQSQEFHKTACLKTKDGMLLFGGVNGFNAFYPENIVSNNVAPNVVITDFKLFNQEVAIGKKIKKRIILPKSISETDEIELDYSENFISFGFTALNYTSPEKNQYSYIMEGFDKDWRMVNSKKRNATYTNLDPGTYTFKVKASNNEGVWNNEGTSISILIHPPLWETWWFRILFILVFSMILLFSYRLRISALTKQKKILEDTVYERTEQLVKANKDLKEINATKDKFVSIIAHDILSPFNTIIGFSEIMIENFNEWAEQQKIETINSIYTSSKSLYDLLVNLLEWSKSARGLVNISRKKIDLIQVIQKNVSFIKFSANVKDIRIETKNTNSTIAVFSDVHIINTIFRNLISNAIKFTPKKGTITINVITKNQFAYVSIKDNGVGISDEKKEALLIAGTVQTTLGTNNEKGNGLGLNLVKEFVVKQGGKLSIDSKIGKGSTFTFSIPLWEKNSING